MVIHIFIALRAKSSAPLTAATAARTALRDRDSGDQVTPTHVNRHTALLEEAADYALAFNASVDVTAFEDAGAPELLGCHRALLTHRTETPVRSPLICLSLFVRQSRR